LVCVITLGSWATASGDALPALDGTGDRPKDATAMMAPQVPESLIQRICDTPQNLTGPVPLQGPFYPYETALVWDGLAYGVVWCSMPAQYAPPRLYFARVAADGTVLIGPTLVSDGESQSHPSLAWTGANYGLVWYGQGDPSGLYFARLDTSGCIVGEEVYIPLTYYPDMVLPCLVWSGAEYGLAWVFNDGFQKIYVTRLSAEGTKLGLETELTPFLFAYQVAPSMVWTGAEYGLAWQQDDAYPPNESDIFFARFDATMGKIGVDIPVASAAGEFALEPSITWTGTEYGVAWVKDSKVYLSRLDATGTNLGSDTLVTDAALYAHYPSLAWTGAEYGLTWQDYRHGGTNPDIYFARVNAAGTKQGSDMAITSATARDYNYPRSLAFGSRGYGMAWGMVDPSPTSVRFTGLGCHADTTPPSCPVSPAEVGRTNVDSPESHTVTLAWGPSQDYESEIARYVITRDGMDVGTTADRTWTDTDFDPTSGHLYWVTALNALGYGSQGCTASVDTSDHVPPTCPSNLLGTLAPGGTSVTITWLPSADAKSGLRYYRIYRNNIFQLAGYLTCSYTDVSLSPGTTYNFGVTAVDWAGNEQTACQSLWVSTSPITLMIHKESDGLNAHLEWNDVNLNEYVIYRSTSPQVAAELERVAPTEAMDPVLHDGVRLWYYFIQQKE
jgi:hypothetical protein